MKQVLDQNQYTLPKLIRKHAEVKSKSVALRKKFLRVWHAISWAEYFEETMHLGLALHSKGFSKNDRVVLLGENNAEFVFMQISAMSLRGQALYLHAGSLPDEVATVLTGVNPKIIFAEDQEQVDKLIQIRSSLVSVEKVIFLKKKGMNSYKDNPWIMSYSELKELGKKIHNAGKHDNLFNELIDAGEPGDSCHLCLGSCESDEIKISVFNHRQLILQAETMVQVEGIESDMDYVPLTSMASLFEQIFSIYMPIVKGPIPNFPESYSSALRDFKEISPQIVLADPKTWNTFYFQFYFGFMTSYKIIAELLTKKDDLVNTINDIGDHIIRGRSLPLGLRLRAFFLRLFLLASVKNQLGLRLVKKAYCFGGSIGCEIFTFFSAMNINIKITYGLTELGGFCSLPQISGDPIVFGQSIKGIKSPSNQKIKYLLLNPALLICYFKFQKKVLRFSDYFQEIKKPKVLLSCGKPLPSIQIELSPDMELKAKSSHMHLGYLNFKGETVQSLEEGWFLTGDIACLGESNDLVFMDRTSGLVESSRSDGISCYSLENKLNANPFIKESCVQVDHAGYLFAIICFNPMNVRLWLQKKGYSYTTYRDMCQSDLVGELLLSQVMAFNLGIERDDHKIRRFVVSPSYMDDDTREITRSGKLRRSLVRSKFSELIKAVHDSPPPSRTAETLVHRHTLEVHRLNFRNESSSESCEIKVRSIIYGD